MTSANLFQILNGPEFPMDVSSITSSRLYTRSRHLLPGPCATKLPSQNASRWYTSVRDQATFSRRHIAPGKCAPLSSHLRHQPTKAT